MKMLHKPHYPVAMQMAKKFVSKEEIRPVLTMVYHRDNGDIVATDSHRLLWVKDVHGFRAGGDATNIVCEGGLLVNPKTFEIAEQTEGQVYPNTDTFIPTRSTDAIRLTLAQVKVWHQAHKSMKQMHDVLEVDDYYSVKLHVDQEPTDSIGVEQNIRLLLDKQGHKIEMNLPFTKCDYNAVSKVPLIAYNAQYMADCLEVMVKLKSEEVGIQFGASVHEPITLWSADEKAIAVLVPIRTYS